MIGRKSDTARPGCQVRDARRDYGSGGYLSHWVIEGVLVSGKKATRESVSYTHLDVYKRQDVNNQISKIGK